MVGGKDMNSAIKTRYRLLSKKLIKNLNMRKFDAYYCDTKEEAKEKVLSLIPKEHIVSWGGSVSLEELGILEVMRDGSYHIIDRGSATTPEEKYDLNRRSILCDTFLMGTNAISEDGILINVDGNGNRVAALCCGPHSVIVVVGMNKVVPTREDAYMRARHIASPTNTQRVYPNLEESEKMPCLINGACANCMSENCICSSIVETRMSNTKHRIKVVLVGEDLGF